MLVEIFQQAMSSKYITVALDYRSSSGIQLIMKIHYTSTSWLPICLKISLVLTFDIKMDFKYRLVSRIY